jgi:hypothetical protein
VLLKRNSITNVRIWNNATKTTIHDGWVLLTEKGIHKCIDEKCANVSELFIDYKNVDDNCRVK